MIVSTLYLASKTINSPSSTESQPRYRDDDNQASNGSSLDKSTFMLMILAILVPIVFTLILCVVTYFIYRYNKKLTARTPTNSSIIPNNRSNAPISTIVYNNQHSPYLLEELPPSYDSLTDVKKHLQRTTTTNPYEQLPLATLPNTALTNANEDIVEVSPTAPTPPPSYTSANELHK